MDKKRQLMITIHDLTVTGHPEKSLANVWFNSLSMWPSDAVWGHRYESTLARVMACCLTAPSHYLSQCWLSMRSSGIHLRVILQEMPKMSILDMSLKITTLRIQPNISADNEWTHWGWDKIATIMQTTFLDSFSWVKIIVFCIKFHCNLFTDVL